MTNVIANKARQMGNGNVLYILLQKCKYIYIEMSINYVDY